MYIEVGLRPMGLTCTESSAEEGIDDCCWLEGPVHGAELADHAMVPVFSPLANTTICFKEGISSQEH